MRQSLLTDHLALRYASEAAAAGTTTGNGMAEGGESVRTWPMRRGDGAVYLALMDVGLVSAGRPRTTEQD